MLYLIFTILSVITLIFVLLPLKQKHINASISRSEQDVYKSQLQELERDKNNAVISAQDAEAQRAEIARRLLALETNKQTDISSPEKPNHSLKLAFTYGFVAIILSGVVYSVLGSPMVSGQSYASRLENAGEQEKMLLMIQQVQDRLASNPSDGRGWEVIAPIYARMGRFEDSAIAWRNAMGILGMTPERLLSFAIADIQANDGNVKKEAFMALSRAEASDADIPQVSFFLALADEQNGAYGAALFRLNQLLERFDENEPWINLVRDRIAAVEKLQAEKAIEQQANTKIEPEETLNRGPSQEDVEAASTMTPTERNDMIRSMVSGLEERLFENGGSVKQWMQLIRSLSVLGHPKRIEAAISAAKEDMKDNQEDLNAFDSFISSLN